MKRFLLLLAAISLFVTACVGGLGNDDNGGTPSMPKIELSQQTIDVEFEPDTYTIEVSSPYSWKAESDNDWIIVESKTGIAGVENLEFKVARNEEEKVRKGTITVYNSTHNLSAELYVTQKAFVPTITIEPETLNFAVEGGEQTVAITANFEYEVTVSADWVSYTKTENGITVTIPNYVEVEERTAEITISKKKYNIFKTIKVSQEARDVDTHPQGRIVAVRTVPVQEGSFIIPITTESYLTCRPLNSWLHLSETNQEWKQETHNITIHYDSNESSAFTRKFARIGHLALESYDGFTVDTIVVKQKGLTPYMKLEDMEIEAYATECKIAFNTNLTDECRSSLTFSADRDWILSINYLDDGCHLLFKFTANYGAERIANISAIFTDAWGETTEAKCMLTQKTAIKE